MVLPKHKLNNKQFSLTRSFLDISWQLSKSTIQRISSENFAAIKLTQQSVSLCTSLTGKETLNDPECMKKIQIATEN